MKDKQNTVYTTREQWLRQAMKFVEEHFVKHGYSVPEVSVTCGWPSVKGTARKSRRIGECWSPEAASDKHAAIFISPVLGTKVDAECDVLAVLVHEVIHAVVGLKCGHRGPFKKCMKAVGLEGKATATTATKELQELMAGWAEELGRYPHGVIQPGMKRSGPKKQTTRMIKCVCEACGYSVRTTKKWLVDVGAPHCPIHGAMKFELPEETEEDDGE